MTRCTHCKGFNVYSDAYVGINDGDIKTYDDTHCEDCEGECSTEAVEMVAVDDIQAILESLCNYARDSTLDHDPVPMAVKVAEAMIEQWKNPTQ